MQKFAAEILELLSTPRRVVVTTHQQPDGDALGSSLGWMKFLQGRGHSVHVVSPTSYTPLLKWMTGSEHILVYDDDKQRSICEQLLAEAEVLFCLDFNAIQRLDKMSDVATAAPAIKVVIDHHQQPEAFAAFTWSDTHYAATAEMITDLIIAMKGTQEVTADMAENLYTGIGTDTGFFQYSNTSPRVLQLAAFLTERGAQPHSIADMVNNVFSEKRLRLFGFSLYHKLNLVKGGRVAIMSLTTADAKKFYLQQGETEGLVNFPFRIEGVKVCALFIEEKDRIKISLRSKDQIDVNNFARRFFNGGGHTNAAGGKTHISLEATIELFINNLDQLL